MIFSSAAEGVASPKAQVRSTAKCSEAWFSGLLEEWSPDLIPFWTLAVANVYRKAKSAADYGKVSRNADYTWGTAVTLSDLKPGDVIQFRNYVYTSTVVTKTDGARGIDPGRTVPPGNPVSPVAEATPGRRASWLASFAGTPR